VNKEKFDAAAERMTKTQRTVLKQFLAGKTDEANICRIFELKNEVGEHFSYRQELIELFAKFSPELVDKQLIEGRLKLEFPEGQVPVDSIFYVERLNVESDCYQEVMQPGSLILIKAPKMMGKTSLLTRIMSHGVRDGCRTVQLNLRLADGTTLNSLDRFLRSFCQIIGRELQLEDRIAEYWDLELLSSNYNCTAYFEEYLLPQINCPLALGLDESDRLFQYPEIARDFFGLLRLWHEKGKNPGIWQQLRLVVVYNTEVYIKLDANTSPFNVGLPIDLPELTPAQIQNLASRHQLKWNQEQVSQLMAMVGGHPYLVRLAMYWMKRADLTLENILEDAINESGIYSHHLRHLALDLEEDTELLKAFLSVVNASPESSGVERIQRYKLQAMGLVKLANNRIEPRCDLYRQYFSNL
jgi:hypothetical protein